MNKSLFDGPSLVVSEIHSLSFQAFIPGPPFAFGAFIVLAAILAAIFIPEEKPYVSLPTSASSGGGHSSASKSRRPFRVRTAHSESTTNLLHGDTESNKEMGDMETVEFSDQEEGHLEHSVAFAPNATERRRCV